MTKIQTELLAAIKEGWQLKHEHWGKTWIEKNEVKKKVSLRTVYSLCWKGMLTQNKGCSIKEYNLYDRATEKVRM